MKKDKAVKMSSRWRQYCNSSQFFKNIFIYTIFIVLFSISVFILVYRYINREVQNDEFVVPNLSSAPSPAPAPAPEAAAGSVSLENEIALQNNRLNNLETIIKQQQLSLKSAQQLIAFEILCKVLEDGFPLKALTSYLQNNTEPWTTEMLNTLLSVQESKTYEQLQELLVLPPSPQIQPSSLGQRIKNLLGSFVSIQKLDEDGYSTLGRVAAIHSALQAHKIQQALELFSKLPPKEQAELSSWKKEAQNRLVLETLKQQMLLELSRN